MTSSPLKKRNEVFLVQSLIIQNSNIRQILYILDFNQFKSKFSPFLLSVTQLKKTPILWR